MTTCASQSVLLVSDGVAGVLQAGNSYSLQAAGGSHILLTARAALPLAPSFGHSPSGRQHGPQTARHTLGGWSVAISRSVEGSIKPWRQWRWLDAIQHRDRVLTICAPVIL